MRVLEKRVPTTYELLARKHGVTVKYVSLILNGNRMGKGKKGRAVLADLKRLSEVPEAGDEWMSEFTADGGMVFRMEGRDVWAEVKDGTARALRGDKANPVVLETADAGEWKPDELMVWLRGVFENYEL